MAFKPANNMNLAEAYKVLAISFDLITKEEADKAAKENGVAWYMPYKEAVEAKIEVPSFIDETLDHKVTRGEFFYLLNELI